MQRLTRLDGLRGVLAVYVMLGHALPVSGLPALITAPFTHGEAAVDLFFALSGLVIAGSLEHHDYKFRPFILARAKRLLPVYFLVLVLGTGITALGSPALPWVANGSLARDIIGAGLPPRAGWHLAAHIFLLHGIIPQGVLPFAYVTLLGPAWSLSTEWQFYLLIALVLPRIPAQDRLAWFTVLILGAGILYRLAAPNLTPFWQFSRAFLPDAAIYFALGLATAVWLRGGGALLLRACFAIACLLGLISGEPGKLLIPLAWAFAIGLQKLPAWHRLGAVLDSRAAQYLGAISYPLYLVNEPVQHALILAIAPYAQGNAALFTAAWLPPALIFPVLAAIALHHIVEKPMARPGEMPNKSESGPGLRNSLLTTDH